MTGLVICNCSPNTGYAKGSSDGYSSGKSAGYNEGYSAGRNDGFSTSRSGGVTAGIIWNGWTSYGGVQSANHGDISFTVTVTGNQATLKLYGAEYGISASWTFTLS